MKRGIEMIKKHLYKRVVLVTGASGGIGRAAAMAFAKLGDFVAVHYNANVEVAHALVAEAQEQGYEMKAFQGDLTKSCEVNDLFSEIEKAFGPVEVLINASGYSEQCLCHEITDDSWQKTMAINLDASFYCARRAIPNMIDKRSGVILNISSIWGLVGGSMEVHYSTAKAALIGMTKAMAKELGPSGIRVNCLAPGWIDTPMNHCHDDEATDQFLDETPLGRLGTPEEIAKWIVFFVCRGGQLHDRPGRQSQWWCSCLIDK